MRRLGCFLLVFVCAISSCKKEKKNNFKGTIGLTVLSLDNPYFKALADAAQEEAAKNGYNVLVTSGDFDPSKQRNQINDFIIKEVDAIILTPVDSKSSGIVVRKCNEMVSLSKYGLKWKSNHLEYSSFKLNISKRYSLLWCQY